MNEIFEKSLLFDFYGELLTDKQKQLYALYHQDDLSLGEISEQLGISRQGVFDALKRCDHQLHHFEEKLKLVEHFVKNKSRIEEIYQSIILLKSEGLSEDGTITDGKVTMKHILQIEEIAREILEDL